MEHCTVARIIPHTKNGCVLVNKIQGIFKNHPFGLSARKEVPYNTTTILFI